MKIHKIDFRGGVCYVSFFEHKEGYSAEHTIQMPSDNTIEEMNRSIDNYLKSINN